MRFGGPLRGPPGDFYFILGFAAAARGWKKGRKKSVLCVGPAGFGGATGAPESKTQGLAWRDKPRAQRRPAGRPWANEPQMKNTQHTEAVVSARRRRRAVEAAPKIIFEIWIPRAYICRPAGAPRLSMGRGPGGLLWAGLGGCPDVGRGWASPRRRKPPVPLRRLRPRRAAMQRRGPAGAGVAPRVAQDLPRGHGQAARQARRHARAPCPALPPGAPALAPAPAASDPPPRKDVGTSGASPPK